MATTSTRPSGLSSQRSPLRAEAVSAEAAAAAPGASCVSILSDLGGAASSPATVPTSGAELDQALSVARVCECCRGDHDGGYGSGRFCSVHCARRVAASRKWAKRRLSMGPGAASDSPQTTNSTTVNLHKRQRSRPASPGPDLSTLTLPSPTRSTADLPLPSPLPLRTQRLSPPPSAASVARRARRHEAAAKAARRAASVARRSPPAVGDSSPAAAVGGAARRPAAPRAASGVTSLSTAAGPPGGRHRTAFSDGAARPAVDYTAVRLPPIQWRPVPWAGCQPPPPPCGPRPTAPRPPPTMTSPPLTPDVRSPSPLPVPATGGAYRLNQSSLAAPVPRRGAFVAPIAGVSYAPLPPCGMWVPSMHMVPAPATVSPPSPSPLSSPSSSPLTPAMAGPPSGPPAGAAGWWCVVPPYASPPMAAPAPAPLTPPPTWARTAAVGPLPEALWPKAAAAVVIVATRQQQLRRQAAAAASVAAAAERRAAKVATAAGRAKAAAGMRANAAAAADAAAADAPSVKPLKAEPRVWGADGGVRGERPVVVASADGGGVGRRACAAGWEAKAEPSSTVFAANMLLRLSEGRVGS